MARLSVQIERRARVDARSNRYGHLEALHPRADDKRQVASAWSVEIPILLRICAHIGISPLVTLSYLISYHEGLPFADGIRCRFVRDRPRKRIRVLLLLGDGRSTFELHSDSIRIKGELRCDIERGHPCQKSSDNDDRHLRHTLRADLLEFELDQATHGVLLFLRCVSHGDGSPDS